MFVGHALLAFAAVALVADWYGYRGRRAVALGCMAGAFAAIPDVDVAYAAFALDVGQVAAAADAEMFWAATNEVHRTITHSLVIAVVAPPAFGLWAWRGEGSRAGRIGALAVVLGLVGVAHAVTGASGTLVMALFGLAGLAVATVAATMGIRPRTVAALAAVGLLSHPWGDLVTGGPPALFYPFTPDVVGERVLLHADPTLHLLGAFAIELAAIWLAAWAIVRATDLTWSGLIDRRSLVGVAYGPAALVLAPPTLAVSYHFVFSIIPIGIVCGGLSGGMSGRMVGPGLGLRRGWPRIPRSVSDRSAHDMLGMVLTGLTGITVALLSYATVYLLIGG